jgi:hypothetical protein
MDAASWAAILVGFFGLVSGISAAILSLKAQRTTARASEIASVIEGYDELVKNLRAEEERLRSVLRSERNLSGEDERQANEDLRECEGRCRLCYEQLGELLADLAALRAITRDEVARAAAQSVIDETQSAVDNATALAESRTFLRSLSTPGEAEDPSAPDPKEAP